MNPTPEQQAVIDSRERNLLVTACPGAGKTATVAHKAARWIADGLPASSIAVITFTRRAAHEIKQRIRKLVGPDADNVFVGTFHSLCFAAICRSWQAIGYRSGDLLVLDRADTKTMLMEAMIAARETRVTVALTELSRYGAGLAERSAVIRAYEEILIEENLCDNSLLARTVLLLLEAGNAEELRERCRNLIVDEAQDSDHSQMQVYRKLAEQLVIVGDPQQSIYGWRGADPRLFDTLAGEPGFATAKLTTNFRSARSIVETMSRFAHVAMHAHEEAVFGCSNVIPESSVHEIISLSTGPDAGTTAIIARTNWQVKEWSNHLTNAGVTHQVVGAHQKLIEAPDVKIALAYLAFPDLPDVGIVFDRVLQAESFTRTDVARMRAEAREQGFSLYARAMHLEKLSQFYQEIGDEPLFERMISCCARVKRYRGGMDAPAIEALREELVDFIEQTPRKFQSAAGFVNWLAVADLSDKRLASPVVIMTAHQAKGLEFDRVFVVGLDDKLWPYGGNESDDMQEERRAFYVAATRARRALYVVRPESGIPSRFIAEVAEEAR